MMRVNFIRCIFAQSSISAVSVRSLNNLSHRPIRSKLLPQSAVLLRKQFCTLISNSFIQEARNFCSSKASVKVGVKENYTSNYKKLIMSLPQNAKEFSFNDYDIIGFDLDCTLLRYNLSEMVALQYKILCHFLVEKKGYPAALLEQSLDYGFLQKGLILDAEHGNVLKLSRNGTILRATHGTKPLSAKDIESIYGKERTWSIATQFFEDPLSTWNGPLSTKLRTLLDYFDLPVSLVFAQAVDILDAQQKPNLQDSLTPNAKIYSIWPDILEGLCEMYVRENFSNGCSPYFNALLAEPERYLLRTSAEVIQWISDLRAAGKAVYLLTGSNIDFAHFTSNYALGPKWETLFDCIVTFAKKPGFFTMQRPFLQVDRTNFSEIPNSEINIEAPLQIDNIYSQGNWVQLRKALAAKIGKAPEKVRCLYVGDNVIQDIYSPVKHHDLDALGMCEEMLAEDDSVNQNDYQFRNIIGSPTHWGSYFCVDGEHTLWANYIENYAEMCIPGVDTVAVHPITHRYCLDKKLRYFPAAPKSLATN